MNNVTEILTQRLERIKASVQDKILQEGRAASGKTAASLNVVISGLKGTLFGSKSMLAIERGRGPGRVPYGFVGIIREWIKAKGITVKPIPSKRTSSITPEERGLNSMAGAIAYTIMKKGTRMFRDKTYNDIYSTVLDEELEAMAGEISLGVVEEISSINDRMS